MAKIVPLDKVLAGNTEYETDDRELLVIKRIGTNSATTGQLFIDRKPTTRINSTVAPLAMTTTNLNGLLDLGGLFNVVLPRTKLQFMGASGCKVRIAGYKVQLDPMETPDRGLIDRAIMQFRDYLTVVEGTYTHGVDTAWVADIEKEILALTPKTTEEYILNNIAMANVANVSGGVVAGDWAIRFYLENAPLEFVYGTLIKPGIDVTAMPMPPAGTTEMKPFSLADFPIDVPGDRTLSVRAANISGASKSPTTGTSIIVTFNAVARYTVKV
jgi:hypothetical protein